MRINPDVRALRNELFMPCAKRIWLT